MSKNKRVIYHGFLPFERQQFEDYLNALYRNGFRLKFEEKSFVLDKTTIKFFCRVELLPKDEKDKQQIIDTYQRNGYQYISQIKYFGIFESQENQPIYINEIIEEEILSSIVIKDLIQKILIVLGIVVGYISFFMYFSLNIFINNAILLTCLYTFLGMIVLPIYYFYFYRLYFQKRNLSYSYQACLLRDYFSRGFFILFLFSEAFLFGTQSLIVALLSPLIIPLIAMCYYFYTKCTHKVLIIDKMILLLTIIIFTGSLMNIRSVDPIIPQLPYDIEEYGYGQIEQTIFLDSVSLYGEGNYIGTVFIKYDWAKPYILKHYIGDQKILSQEYHGGYKIIETETFTYISKGNNIVKLDYEGNIDEFVKGLNWK